MCWSVTYINPPLLSVFIYLNYFSLLKLLFIDISQSNFIVLF